MSPLPLRPGERVALIVLRRPVKRGEIWWADLGAYRSQEQTGRRPVIVWQSDTLPRLLQSVLVVPLTTNLDRTKPVGTALVVASDGAPAADSVALAFQLG